MAFHSCFDDRGRSKQQNDAMVEIRKRPRTWLGSQSEKTAAQAVEAKEAPSIAVIVLAILEREAQKPTQASVEMRG
jgi:hypothetical protein